MQAQEIERYLTIFRIEGLKGAIAGRLRLAKQVPDWKDWHLRYVAQDRAALRKLQEKLNLLEQL